MKTYHFFCIALVVIVSACTYNIGGRFYPKLKYTRHKIVAGYIKFEKRNMTFENKETGMDYQECSKGTFKISSRLIIIKPDTFISHSTTGAVKIGNSDTFYVFNNNHIILISNSMHFYKSNKIINSYRYWKWKNWYNTPSRFVPPNRIR